MALIGQPETYADVLKRVFGTTLATGFACSLALAHSSPDVKSLLDAISVDAELGPVKGIKLLYVALPAAVALASRVVKLHDRVSDVLGLRRKIEVDYILFPLAEGVGVELDDARRMAIRMNRRNVMYKSFYPYVSLPNSAIDSQLVRTALDNFGWLWAGVEALVLALPTAVALAVMGDGKLAPLAFLFSACLSVFLWFQWRVCKRGSAAEVHAILEDEQRRTAIRQHLESL